ncbi:MAG: hypothetical protein KF729_26785 [Sandaracinaceae bacterium]|nr:hypothetical protein [Sandaracinaceae bacterium]
MGERAVWRAFLEQQRACYARYGAGAAAHEPELCPDLLWLLCVFDDDGGELVAGARIQVRAPDQPLPLEQALASIPRVAREVARRYADGIGEVGALWSAPSRARSGIGGAVIAASVACAAAIGVRHLVSLAHQHNRFTRRVGFEPDARIGALPYPDDRYRSTVNFCDARDAPTADPDVRRAILAMRRNVLRGEPADLDLYPVCSGEGPDGPTREIPQGVIRMSNIAAKSRPTRHPQRRGTPRPLVEGVHVVETSGPPDEAARALFEAGPRLTASSASADTTVTLRAPDGALLAVASVTRGDRSLLAGASPRVAYVGDLAWREGDEAMAALVLYAAARRARIDGASTIAAHVCDPHRAVTGALGLEAIEGLAWVRDETGARPRSLVPAANRLDLAIDRAWAAFAQVRDERPSPEWFIDEVDETIERWLADLYGRGFFRAVFERTLTREQYVYAASNMHQFVRWTTRLLGLAVGSSHERATRDHFLGHLAGEVNHEIIIERDLAHLDVDVSYVVERMAPSPHTRHFMAVQESLIGFHHDPVAFMASPLAAEGIASHLTPAFVDALEATIAGWGVSEPRRAMTFFTSHVHTDGGDDGHWETTLGLLRAHLDAELVAARFLATLRSSMSALTGAYDEYVDDVESIAPHALDTRALAAAEACAAEE